MKLGACRYTTRAFYEGFIVQMGGINNRNAVQSGRGAVLQIEVGTVNDSQKLAHIAHILTTPCRLQLDSVCKHPRGGPNSLHAARRRRCEHQGTVTHLEGLQKYRSIDG